MVNFEEISNFFSSFPSQHLAILFGRNFANEYEILELDTRGLFIFFWDLFVIRDSIAKR